MTNKSENTLKTILIDFQKEKAHKDFLKEFESGELYGTEEKFKELNKEIQKEKNRL